MFKLVEPGIEQEGLESHASTSKEIQLLILGVGARMFLVYDG
jgi:hypothetical protein